MTVFAIATLADGRRAEWHDDLGTVGRYRIVNADGTTASERDYDAFEQGQRAERASRATMVANDATLRQQAKDAVAAVRASSRRITTAKGRTDAQIAGNTAATAASIRSLVDEMLVTNAGLVAIARLVGQELSSTDTGPS